MQNEMKYRSDKFKCPHCHVIAQQKWFSNYQLNAIVFNIYDHIYLNFRVNIHDYEQEAISKFISAAKSNFPSEINSFFPTNLSIAMCQSCNDFSIWVTDKIVYPRYMPIVEPPNDDLNNEIKALYNEAARIFIDSPKGSAALLRLALQMLLKQLGKKGENINEDIKELVERGLSVKIQKALDILRVVGNNAVHPGQINIDDKSQVALKLFKILNVIAEEMITMPKEIDTLYNDVIPVKTKEQIDQRDKRGHAE